MLGDLLGKMMGGTMEEAYLQLIALLDRAESVASGNPEVVPPSLALEIANVKQRAIDWFAATNRNTTLVKIQEKADEAAKTAS